MKRTELKRKSPLISRSGLQRRSRLSQGAPLAREGQRARRLRQADREEEAASHALPCVCGCNAEPGEVARAHLIRRSAERTRNLAANNMPACAALSEWLDHTPGGVQAKRILRQMAHDKGDRLTDAEFWPIGTAYGYYEWRQAAGW